MTKTNICRDLRDERERVVRENLWTLYGPEQTIPVVQMDAEEAEQLYRFTCNAYLDPNTYPALRRLLLRVDEYRAEKAN